MSVETKVVCSESKTPLMTYSPIEAGDDIFVIPFDDAIVLARCQEGNTCGVLVVHPLNRNFIGAAIFKDLEDKESYLIDTGEPIYFANGQSVVLFSSGCTQEVYVRHVPNEIQSEEPVRLKILQREAAATRRLAEALANSSKRPNL